MRRATTEPAEVWQEYEKGRAYNSNIDLYETVDRNEAFYIGDQWRGVNAPDREKPVLNFLKRVVTYFIAMIVSDDIGVQITPFLGVDIAQDAADIYAGEVERVIERTKLKSLNRVALRNAAVDGDAYYYYRFDPDVQTGQAATGEIVCELVDNTNLIFGNPTSGEVQGQPYMILVQRLYIGDVREEAEKAGVDPDSIRPDDADDVVCDDYSSDELVTVLTKFYKAGGSVHFVRVTRDVTLQKDTDTGLTLYPFAGMAWEVRKNSCHGQAALTGLIQNQVYVNKLWAMFMEHQKLSAFPKIIYDKTKFPGGWDNRVGTAVGMQGIPNDAVATAYRAPDFSAQAMELVEKTISYTREFMGASDAALGNVKPDNTSAIIAVQKASSAPLELQRRAYFQLVEDSVRVMVDIIHASYGARYVEQEDELGKRVPVLMDFGALDISASDINVEVGAAAYWSELMQMQTTDNLFGKGIITDAVQYLESIPDAYIKNKADIIKTLHERAQMMQGPQGQMMQPAADMTTAAANPVGAGIMGF